MNIPPVIDKSNMPEPLHKMTCGETAITVTYWIVFFLIIAAGDIGIFIGVSNLNQFQTPAIFGFMAAYSAAVVMVMCILTGYIAPYVLPRDPGHPINA